MKNRRMLTLADALAMIEAARAEADKNRWAVAIAIADDGGHLLAMQRLDGAAPIAAHIAPEKARSAALGRRASGEYEEMINGGRTAFLSAPALQGMLAGGLPVVVDGECIGAIGISGVKPDQDVQIATAGLAAVKAGA